MFGTKMQRKMRAGAGIEDLKSRCPYFYDVAGILHAVLTAYGRENELPEFVISTFVARYKVGLSMPEHRRKLMPQDCLGHVVVEAMLEKQ